MRQSAHQRSDENRRLTPPFPAPAEDRTPLNCAGLSSPLRGGILDLGKGRVRELTGLGFASSCKVCTRRAVNRTATSDESPLETGCRYSALAVMQLGVGSRQPATPEA